MNRASMGLRRAGAGGLAAAVVAGTLFASGGSALAWTGGTISVTGGASTFLPNGATTAASNLVATLPTKWNVGDTLTLVIANPGNCTTATNEAHWTAATPTFAYPAAYVPVAGDVLPTFTAVASQSAACVALAGSQPDTVTLTFNNSGTNAAAGTPILTVAHSIAVGTTVPAGPLNVSVTAAGTAPLPTVSPSSVAVGTVGSSNVSVSATPVAAKPTVAITAPTTSVKEVQPGQLSGTVTFTYTNAAVDVASVTGSSATASATWSGGGTLVLSATASTVKVAGLTATTSAAGTLSLAGVKITPAAVASGAAGKVVSVAVSGGGVSGTASGVLAADVNTGNTGGSDRYFTAKALYDAFAGGTTTNTANVVLASGANFPDALSANTLAGALHAGVLLTTPTGLSTPAALAITQHKINTVYIIGGLGAVSAAVEAQVKALSINDGAQANPTIVRLGGIDRYATNNLVDVYANANGSIGATAFIATGADFADALAIGPEVIHTGGALVLTPSVTLGASAKASLIDLGISNVVIVGGTGAVSAAVESAITAMGITVNYRLSGADRTQTAAQIATWATLGVPASGTYAAQTSLGFDKTTVHVANGSAFPDALAAAPYAAATSGGQVILLSNSPTSAGIGGPAFVATLAGQLVPARVGTVNGLGLSGAVSQSVLNAFALSILG